MEEKTIWKLTFILSFVFLFTWFILSLIVFGYNILAETFTFENIIIIWIVSFWCSMIILDLINEL